VKKKKKKKKIQEKRNFGLDIYKYFDRNKWERKKKWWEREIIYKDLYILGKIRYSYARLFYAFFIVRTAIPHKGRPKMAYDKEFYSFGSYYDYWKGLDFIMEKREFFKAISVFFTHIIEKKTLGWKLDSIYAIITNDELSAEYIARHIANAFKSGFTWQEVIVPIRRDLNNLLVNTRFVPQREKNKKIRILW